MRQLHLACRSSAAYVFLILLMPCVFVHSRANAWQIVRNTLPTRWDKDVSPANALPEYPRPQMARNAWQSLNGLWDYGFTGSSDTSPPPNYAGQILVPYAMESALSGVRKSTAPTQRLWYRRTFTIPNKWKGQRVLLHFGAVNWDSTVTVNGKTMGAHRGGYDAFDYDITEALKPGVNELVVSAWNPVNSDNPTAQVLGKQRLHPGSVLYTAATGIWQSVWLEPVPTAHIDSLKITPDVDAKVLRVTVNTESDAASVKVTATDGVKTVATASGKAGTEIALPLPSPHLWSPTDPHLYGLHVALDGKKADAVDSYFAMRKISLGKDEQGRTCILLNNKFIFQVGALDQGYWPDGIYTAPTDDALKYDIQVAKNLGYNLLRKHAKVEPDRWYYWTDKLGMLVWQDIPQAFGDNFTDETKAQWQTELKREIVTHYNHPSIIVWTLFNEGWGQHDTEEITALARQLDPTRLLNSASGGYNQIVNGKMSQYRLPTPAGVGDLNDTHTYPEPSTEKQDPTRALVCGEFGGVGMRVPGHLWSTGQFIYGTLQSGGWQLTKRYQELLKEAYGLRDTQGASAVVYTQIIDVEEELNGLLTYDRAILKPLPAIIKAANQGRFPPMPPAPPPPVSHDPMPTSENTPQIWSYTTDKPGEDWIKQTFDSAAWKTGPAPFGHDYKSNTDWNTNDIWLRHEVTLPAIIPTKLTIVTIHDEDVEVYVNGIFAASETGYKSEYVKLPMSEAARATLKSGKNTIAVHCHQTVGGQVIDVGIAEAGK